MTIATRVPTPAPETGPTTTVTAPATAPAITPAAAPSRAPVRLRWSPGIAGALAAGLLLLGFVGYLGVGSGLRHERDQHTLYASFRGALRHATLPLQEPIAPGSPVALLQIPRLSLTEVVVEGTAADQLAVGPGHRRDTPLPGQPGVAVLAGHRLAYGGPFRHLAALAAGDPITVTTGQGTFRFVVDAVQRRGQARQVLAPSTARLLLVTGGTEVAATLVRYPVAPLGTPPAIASAEVPGHHDAGALVALLLWSQLLLAVGIAAACAWVRVPHSVIWLLATPVALLALLHIYAAVTAALLPNTL
ncbi:MAG TPA: sortase [Mycobacteriales bacterium]|nr:sortase [Mycobacteriales bacterium]